MPASPPFASIILPAYFSHETIAESLASLIAQRCQDFELIVVDSSPDDRAERIIRHSFPQVRYHREPVRLLPQEARNRGAQLASGGVFVFTDPDCVADPDWLERLLAHHRSNRPVVGGSIRSLPGWWNEAVHSTKYQWWDPASPGGRRSELPSGNFSISREVWDQVHGFRGEYFAGDSELCWRIRAAGHAIWFDPRAVVTHTEHPALGPFARERISRGRDFGRMRVRTQRWSRARCLAYLAIAPALPFVMTGRSASYALTGHYALRWLSTMPIQIFGNVLWCWGEATAHWKSLVDRR